MKANGNLRTLFRFINKSLDRKQVEPLPDHYTNDLCELNEDFNFYFTDKIDKLKMNLTRVPYQAFMVQNQ